MTFAATPTGLRLRPVSLVAPQLAPVVRVAFSIDGPSYRDVQLHPRDCRAAMLEFDCTEGGQPAAGVGRGRTGRLRGDRRALCLGRRAIPARSRRPRQQRLK